MYTKVYHHLRGDIMKMKELACVGLGIAGTLLYQKYASKMVEDTFNKMSQYLDKTCEEIDQMM